MASRKIVAGASVLGLAAGGAAIAAAVSPLAAEPTGEKDCGSILPNLPVRTARPATAELPALAWKQQGGAINDASCLSRTPVHGVVAIKSERQIADALAYARANDLTVSAAGAKHSMGGHAFRRGGLVLDMRDFNRIQLDPERRTVTVQAGATWHDIQKAIHPQFAVKAMQSTDIFTVGGSISVNAHGMDHQAGALMNSIRSLKVMLADGRVVTVSRTENPELFSHVVGGYGLFGVILEAELDVVDNDIYKSGREVIATRDFPAFFERTKGDRSVGLMYAHMSTAPGSLLDETIVYTYRKAADQAAERAPLTEVSSTKLRRLTVNLSKRNDFFKSAKWWAEKHIEPRIESCTITRAQAMGDGEACLVSRNDPMHDSVAYLRNALPNDTDILHEYFVPRDRLGPFVDGMRQLFRRHDANVLNASIRVVDAEANALSYARQPAFSVVLYLNQPTDAAGTEAMRALTSDLIDLSIAEGGRFFLPYQLHYSPEQLVRAYPEIGRFFAAKRQWDPEGRFDNTWYTRYAPAVEALTRG